MTTLVSGGEADQAVKPPLSFPDAAPPCFPVIPPNINTTRLEQPKALPQGIPASHVSLSQMLQYRTNNTAVSLIITRGQCRLYAMSLETLHKEQVCLLNTVMNSY